MTVQMVVGLHIYRAVETSIDIFWGFVIHSSRNMMHIARRGMYLVLSHIAAVMRWYMHVGIL